ncbi:MAG: PQQ-binding-like beta-propeller repeat protein [Lentisphaerae bacterium]|nr:PQQ-binding-like beta-propeller repeat protein [Lentisphaerota bacterium]
MGETTTFKLENLGPKAFGDVWMAWRHLRRPADGVVLAAATLSRGGFVIIDHLARQTQQVRGPRTLNCAWALCQTPDGTVYQGDFGGYLYAWDWKSEHSVLACDEKIGNVFTLDATPDGLVYIPEYSKNIMRRFDPKTGKIEDLCDYNEYGKHIRNVTCASDGWVYVNAYTPDPNNAWSQLVALNPATGERYVVAEKGHHMAKDSGGRVFLPRQKWGRVIWQEMINGKPQAVDQEEVRITHEGKPFAFEDGGFIKAVSNKEVCYVDADGTEVKFPMTREDSPVRICSVEYGAGKVWLGTFIPLTLFAYDPITDTSEGFGNPTQTNGEIYNMVYTHDKLYMASYTGASIDRYTPGAPWRKDNSTHANPVHIGRMKQTEIYLHRPHGRAVDPAGNVYFAAHGSYGCVDSGICRIDPKTDEMTSWLYPNTNFNGLGYHKKSGLLIVSERRMGEDDLRLTLISPVDGSTVWSERVFEGLGSINSWLDSDGDTIYGMFAYRATIFAFDMIQRKVVTSLPELNVGDHCYNVLANGLDGRIWGVTNKTVFAVDRELKEVEVLAELGNEVEGSFYHFGCCFDDHGAFYFGNGADLMRLTMQS